MFLPCRPCCATEGCGVSDGKPRTDPKDEGTWVPSGTWTGVGGVTWTFTPNPGDESGETWFFFGSTTTSKPGGLANAAERRDWGNICNWYSNKTTTPSSTSSLSTVLNKRATRLPPADAVVHIYGQVDTRSVGDQTVKHAYFWSGTLFGDFAGGSGLTATLSAHDSTGGVVFNASSVNLRSEVNGGATLNDSSDNLTGTINGGAVFNSASDNTGSSVVNGGATFNDFARNVTGGIVNDGAIFNNSSANISAGVVNNGATFNDTSSNSSATVNGGATFNDQSFNNALGTVNGGATFNDDSCSQRIKGDFFAVPCTRQFVTHPTDLPTCNGTAPAGCDNAADTCGCG